MPLSVCPPVVGHRHPATDRVAVHACESNESLRVVFTLILRSAVAWYRLVDSFFRGALPQDSGIVSAGVQRSNRVAPRRDQTQQTWTRGRKPRHAV